MRVAGESAEYPFNLPFVVIVPVPRPFARNQDRIRMPAVFRRSTLRLFVERQVMRPDHHVRIASQEPFDADLKGIGQLPRRVQSWFEVVVLGTANRRNPRRMAPATSRLALRYDPG